MFKSVLIVSNNSFSKIDNNGKTLESIFSNIDINNISQIYFTERFNPDFEFCNNYYRILDTDLLKGIFKRGTVGEILKGHAFQRVEIAAAKESKLKELLKFSFVQSFCRFCRDILWLTGIWKTNTLTEWCLRQSPDFIFFVGGSGRFSHNVANYLSEILKVPIVTYFTDDYFIYPKKRNLFDFVQYYQMKKFYRSTINKSSLCFAISDYMCETYSRYFGKLFFPIMNSVSFEEYLRKVAKEDEVVINYFGSIHTNRWKMIVKLASILKSLNQYNIIINVYIATKPPYKVLKSLTDSGINYKGGVFGKELKQKILQSDILLHVESDDIYSMSRTKLSISTKIPEYLISGRPILGFGPKDVASMKLLIEKKIGVVVSPSDDLNLIQSELEKLISDSSYRENLGKKGYDYAINNFDNKKIVQNFNAKIEQMLAAKIIQK